MTVVRTRGQASTEYVAILLVVATLLAVAAIAVPGVGERVVATVRTGICIVGGDLCRTADATAAGLDPCVTSARSRRDETTVDIAIVRFGGNGEWQVALRSDGSAEVTRLDETEAGGTIGIGVTFSPAGLSAGASAAFVAGYRGGRAWRFPDARAALAFLDDAGDEPARPSDVRWRALTGRGSAEAGVALGELARAGVDLATGNAIGLRSDGARRTLTLDLAVEAPRFSTGLLGLDGGGAGASGSWIVDLSWEHGALRELALRSASGDGERTEEWTARLDLRDPGNRALAARLLRPGSPAFGDLRALAARIRSHGTIERHGWRTEERSRGFSVAGRLGVALGLSHHEIAAERRLTDAVAWVRGGPAQRRFDCLGV
jgi:hypothetical protein